jgi:DNA-binding CsgD family transcriptional regulator
VSYSVSITRLTDRDLKSAFDLGYDAASLTGAEPFPVEFLARLAELIPADAIVGYHEAVIGRPCRVVESVEIPAEGIPPRIQQLGGRFWYQDPLRHGIGKHESRALKLSDFITRRSRRQLDFYWHVWKPLGIDDSLRVWLPAPAGRARVIYLERGGRDFTERDRAILQVLRPALIRIHRAALKRRQASRPTLSSLTKRERQILTLIAQGKTSRQIAALLVVSPYTVRKHTEHILEKLDVHTRSAAVAYAFNGTPPDANAGG